MSMVCQKCRHQLPLPPHSLLFRCECGNLIPLGSSESSLPVQEHGRFSSKMRRFRNKFTNSLSPSPSVSPRLSLIFTKPSPSGKRALLCGVTRRRKEAAYKPPTRRNILEAFKWLMEDLKWGDSLVFYFSVDDELDGFDETICPLDFSTQGMISDNAINDILVKPLISGVTFHAIVDSCHSGTVLDLPWVYKELSLPKKLTGAMTYAFIKVILENTDITYQGLLDYMHKAIEKVNKASCALLKVLQRKIDQEPVLSSSEKFNANIRFRL
ncbi:unnamed protein product [Withania somnifera]